MRIKDIISIKNNYNYNINKELNKTGNSDQMTKSIKMTITSKLNTTKTIYAYLKNFNKSATKL